MEFNYIRRGAGKLLLLIHGLGGSWRSRQTILDDLASERSVVAVDLPGHGAAPKLKGATIAILADAVTEFLCKNNLTGVDSVGSSMGAPGFGISPSRARRNRAFDFRRHGVKRNYRRAGH